MSQAELTGYELLLPLDRSGPSETWVGRGEEGDRLDVVLVELLPPDFDRRDDLVERLVTSARTGSRLDVEGLVVTREAGRLEGRLALVHELPHGDSLRRLLSDGQLPMRAALRVIGDVIDICAELHTDHELHHGAIHPEVVYLDWNGRVRLAGLGPERHVRRARQSLGQLNSRQLSYLSPEHCTDDPLDRRTDVFNVGILLWELLTGRVLYDRDDQFERMRAICEQEAPPPTRFNDNVPPLLNSLTLKALAIDPEARFRSAGELAEAFEGVLAQTNERPDRSDTVDALRSAAPKRLKHWQGVEQAIRHHDLEDLVEHLGALHGVDPSQVVVELDADQVNESTRRYGEEATRKQKAGDIEPEQKAEEKLGEVLGGAGDSSDEAPRSDEQSGPLNDGGAALSEWQSDEDADPGNEAPTSELPSNQPSDPSADDGAEAASNVGEDEADDGFGPTEPDTDAAEDILLEKSGTEGSAGSTDDDLYATLPDGAAPDPTQPPDDEPDATQPADDAPDVTQPAGADPDATQLDADEPTDDPDESTRRSSSPSPDEVEAQLDRMSADEWLDDGEEDQTPPERPFSLDDIIEDRDESELARDEYPCAEMIRLFDDRPLDLTCLQPGERWGAEGEPVELDLQGDELVLRLDASLTGSVLRADAPEQPRRLPDGACELALEPGDIATLHDGDIAYRIRFFHPPQTPDHLDHPVLHSTLGLYGVSLGAAVVAHIVAAATIFTLHSSFGVAMSVGDKPKKETFAEGKLKKPPPEEQEESEPEEPPEPEPPTQPPEPREPVDPAEQEAEVPEQVQKELDKRVEQKQKQAEGKSKADALAAALEGSGGDDGGGGDGKSIGEAVSNIDGADSNADSADLEIGGKIEGTEGDDVQIAQGDGSSSLGDIGDDLGEGTGELEAREDGGNEVRGQVESVDAQTEVEGRLAREKIVEVINQHQGDIQGCYERELLSNAGLGGKVTFEWTVTRRGQVSGARQKSSTLGSPTVSNCILDILRSLEFPKPKGGSVTVSYPFMFRSGG
jgi:serine/threonine protein kinase/outer membrane biosynthesis protein TonB